VRAHSRYGAEEADLLSHKFVGTEHLFLGILRESSCFAATKPIVMFNVVRRGKGGLWEGIYSFNFQTKELTPCISKEQLILDEPHGRMWISELLSLFEDGGTLLVGAAVEKAVSGGGAVTIWHA